MKQYEHFQKNLKDYKVTVDKDKLWANTLHAIPKKRKRRGAFIFLLAGILTMAGGLYLFTSHTQGDPTTVSTSENISSSTNQPLQSKSTNKTTTFTANPNSNASLPANEIKTAPVILDPANHPEKDETKSTTPKSAFKSSQTKANDPIHTNTAKAEKIISKETLPSIDISPNSTPYKSEITTQSPHIEEQETLVDHPVLVEIAADPSYLPASQYLNESEPQTIRQDVAAEHGYIIPVVALSSIPVNDHLRYEDKNQLNQPPIIPANKQKMYNPFGLQIMQSFGWTTYNMESTEAELAPTVASWQRRITSLENIATSIHTTMRLPKGIQLGAGIQYNTMATRIAYNTTTSQHFTTTGINSIIIGADGSAENVIGDVHGVRETYTRSIRYSNHQRLDAELMLQVPFYSRPQMTISAWVKGGVNVLYNSAGTTFGPDDNIVKYDADTNPYTLSSPFTFGGGVNATYRLSPTWSIQVRAGIEPFRYTHGLFDNNIQFNHLIYNLGLGTAYQF